MNKKIITDFDKVELLLEKYGKLDIDIKAKEYEIQSEGLKAVNYDQLTQTTNNNSSPVESQLHTIEKLKNEKLDLEIKKEAIENLFLVLNDLEREFIMYNYVEQLTYKEISNKIGLCAEYLPNKKTNIINKLIPYAKKYRLII